MGGLTRISSFIQSQAEQVESESKSNFLKLDAGSAIAGREDHHALQHRQLLGALGKMEFAAANLGGREATLSAGVLSGFVRESPVPLVSANLFDEASGKPVANPFVIVDYNEMKIGIAGVVDPKSIKPSLGESLVARDMKSAVREVLPDLSAQADVAILLAFTDESGLRDLAREFFEFDLILGGDVRQPMPAPEKVNQSWIAATTNQARALGEIEATFSPEKKSLHDVSGTVHLMAPYIEQDPEIAEFASAYREEVRQTQLMVDNPEGDTSSLVPGVKPSATFVGSESCAGCHPKAFDIWLKSGHARAFDSLVAKQSEADPSCVRCHVVGFGEPGGYLRSFAEERKLIHVGCESCHGPGSQHVEVRTAALANPNEPVHQKMRGVGEGQCTQCHYGEFSRPFDWKEFWPLIEHGKE